MSEETKTLRKAEREYKKRMNALTPIANKVLVIGEDQVSVNLDGVIIHGEVEKFNKIVEKLGYRPVRLTRNMLNPIMKKFAIDIDTPSYCDPGCESYHSM